jgi:hypothetical protein
MLRIPRRTESDAIGHSHESDLGSTETFSEMDGAIGDEADGKFSRCHV